MVRSRSVDEKFLKKMGSIACQQHRTLGDYFRGWLAQPANNAEKMRNFDRLMCRLRHVNARGHFTRREMNQR